jgi:hypothetical protein
VLGLLGLLEIKTILLVYAVGMELDLSFLPDELVRAGFGEQFFWGWGGGGGGWESGFLGGGGGGGGVFK